MPDTHPFFASCAPGLEPLLLAELEAIGARDLAPVAGGVEWVGPFADLYRANLHLGLALRVLIRLGRFDARRWPQLVDGVAALPWEAWLHPGQAVDVRARAHKSRLYHTGGIAERVRGAIAARLGTEPPKGDGPLVQVRLVRDRCTISFDTSGELLSRRGYRLATGKAPLREDLARGLLLTAGWDPSSPLIDPFCGAGTILIEAGMLAAGIPPGSARRFAFMDAPVFEQDAWQRHLDDALGAVDRSRIPPLLGSDRDAGVIEAATANAARADVPVSLACAPVSAAPGFAHPPSGLGAVISNPPYGARVKGSGDLRALYQRFGQLCDGLPVGWRTALVVADRRLLQATGLAIETRLMTDHGGRKVYFAVAE